MLPKNLKFKEYQYIVTINANLNSNKIPLSIQESMHKICKDRQLDSSFSHSKPVIKNACDFLATGLNYSENFPAILHFPSFLQT